MGAKAGKMKKKYLKEIGKQKEVYFKDKLRDLNWMTCIKEEILEAQSMFQNSSWPGHLLSLCENWSSLHDYKWRSNVYWYQFLQQFNSNTLDNVRKSATVLEVEIPVLENSFEAQSLTEFLKNHLTFTEEHIIAAMIFEFQRTFEFTSYTQSIDEIKHFILMALQCLMYYYGSSFCKAMRLQSGELYDLLLIQVFNRKIMYSLLDLYGTAYTDKENFYKNKIIEYRDISGEELGIEVPFRLDRHGYAKAIREFMEIEHAASPPDVLECIFTTTNMICICVDEYWDQRDTQRAKLFINGEQIFSIFMYIVIQADVKHLLASIDLIQFFTRRGLKKGAIGYYITTIENCIEQIIQLRPSMMQDMLYT